MKDPLLNPELREYITSNNIEAFRAFAEKTTPAVVAEYLAAFEPAEIWRVIRAVKPVIGAEIFSFLDDDVQMEIAATMKRDEFAKLLTEMSSDDRVDLLKNIPEERLQVIMPALAKAEREDIRRLSAHEEGTAGSVMTSDYATLYPGLTVAQAIARLRLEAPDKETIYYSYVVDESRKLIGFVSLKDLILARPNAKVGNIMHTEVISVYDTDDQETAARLIQKYDLIALPVISSDDALVGIITYDDAMDIITQEHTEDMEKFMAIGGSHEASVYMKTSVWGHFRNRSPWVVALAILGLVSGFIVQSFEGLLMQFTVLAAFMPMLADTGGNTGSQSATLVVRALALKEISSRDIFRILAREFRISILLAILLGIIAFARVVFYGVGAHIPAQFSLMRIGVAISLALGLQVITSTLVGALLPLGAAKMKWDPAVVASPALTTIVDITGLLIYFTTAKLFLGI
jgi:magnesium transporter